MSDYEKIDDHKYLDGDDDVGNGVCNALFSKALFPKIGRRPIYDKS